MSAPACAIYAGLPSTEWPAQAFPASQYRHKFSAADLREARQAWAFFEAVETQDADTRVRLSGTGWQPSTSPVQDPTLWYVFKDQSEYLRYQRGRYLHIQLCPTYNWTSQRNLGISPTPVTDVLPALC
jgi:hypothetical protein